MTFSRKDIDHYCYLLAKEYKKLNRSNPEAEIVIVGGASILLNYNFREGTTDIDSLIHASSSMKDIINKVGDANGLPAGWLNSDFQRTDSFSSDLTLRSKFYKRFCDCLTVRTVTAEYLVAMKMRSWRLYKNDISDIVGIIKEQRELDNPLTEEQITKAYIELYKEAPETEVAEQIHLMVDIEDLNELYDYTRIVEQKNKSTLLELEQHYPDLINKDNVNSFLSQFEEMNIDIDEIPESDSLNLDDDFDIGDDE